MEIINDVNEMLTNILKLDLSLINNLSPDQSLTDYGLNSLTGIQLIVQIENKYNVHIDDMELLLENMSTKNKIEILIKKYITGS